MCRGIAHARWYVCIRMDLLQLHSLDRAKHCGCSRHHGDLLYIPRNFQLHSGRVSDIRQLGFGRVRVLPKFAWWQFSLGDCTDV